MNPLYKELQPSDAYCVRLPYPFSDFDRQILTGLYQPLVGHEAMAVLFTLWDEAERDGGAESNHYHLLNVLGMPVGRLFESRLALEGIGLLKTYRKSEDGSRSFLYELQPPLDPETFFHDAILSMFLFGKVGAPAYKRLMQRFLVSALPDGYEDVSRSFLEVYKPVTARTPEPDDENTYEKKARPAKLAFDGHDFDFSLLMEGLSAHLVSRKAFTPAAKDMIARLAFLYALSPLEMQQVVLLAIDQDGQLTEERLKRAAADYYKLSVSKSAPRLEKVTALQPAAESRPASAAKTKEDELADYLEAIPPVEMLRQINGGREPVQIDVRLAQKLVLEHGLPTGVVNVLLQYVLLRNDGKLTNNYVERIASHWMAKKVGTAREALELARTEHDKYMNWKQEGGKPSTSRKGAGKTESVPDWFYKKDEKPGASEAKQDESPEIEARRLRLMKKFGMAEGGAE
ncbi:replication initiation and membrane attachment family protein [Edaphobacillus lindanitolerans]|uniref:Replicative DNA helicase loader DnaB n=1 Tax=Edaphobacillus lindanitolerans TaxID=550447 RepID=A0A1U7PMK5_9BACI|nr:DnaD domain protein [Edaphobacillus lindanitolerans]SIT84837.1 replicative DNA helicase loader DnaB [Edaphobacillus lindanitolerans]